MHDARMALYRAERSGNAKQKEPKTVLPLTVKKGHASVKIYRVENRGREMFTLSYRTPAGRQRRMFADLDAARREANTIATNLAGGDLEALKPTGRERQLYVAASEAIAHTGVTLDVVAREFAAAFDILGRDGIIEAGGWMHVGESLTFIAIGATVAETPTGMSTCQGCSPF